MRTADRITSRRSSRALTPRPRTVQKSDNVCYTTFAPNGVPTRRRITGCRESEHGADAVSAAAGGRGQGPHPRVSCWRTWGRSFKPLDSCTRYWQLCFSVGLYLAARHTRHDVTLRSSCERSREGQRERFDKPVVTFFRHSQVLSFCRGEELDLSARHAEAGAKVVATAARYRE